MKNKTLFLSIAVLLIFCMSFTSTKSVEPHLADLNPFKIDFMSTIVNADLEKRFETQFGNMIADVTRIDVHYNEFNEYYYAVYGTDATGKQTYDHFKTTKEEVDSESYNYIEMNERTTNALQKCREATTFPFRGRFCATYNSGPVCGVVVYPFGCFLY